MNTSTILSQPVATATDDLITALLQAEPITAYRQAKAAMDADEATQTLLKHYAEVQSEFRQQQANGTLTQDRINQTRQLQQQVQADPQVAAFVVAQFPARALLDELTEELSSSLEFDFSSLANVSSC
jgi:cell fate (sporulation/competence/biofilm development) regulator YlbF (YheA/YmcA/DUF963 family)